ncbi:MAG: PAS domain S-box protein [Thermodesulfobacteriota bacterium]
MSQIHVMSGPLEGRSFEVDKKTVSIGRTAENDIHLRHNSVSRHHARITRKGDRFFIEDLGSQNGTRVNGQPIKPGEKVEIKEGNFISIADILLCLGEPGTEEGMVTRYSISVTGRDGGTGTSLYKDRRITNRTNLETIHEVSTTLMRSLDIQEICQKIMDALFKNLPRIDSGAVLLTYGNEALGFREIIGRARDPKRLHEAKYSRTVVHRVIHEGTAVMMSDTSLEAECDLSESIKIMQMKSIMCVPLMAQDRVLGALYVHSTGVTDAFRKDDLFLFTALSGPAALAIENALHYARRKKAEEGLKQVQEELEKRIQERTQDLLRTNRLLTQEIQERRHAEEELRETNRFLQNILDSSASISIMSTDVDQNILFWNKGAENLFGYKAEEMVGRKKVDVLYADEETRQEVARIRDRLMREKKEVTSELREVTKDGRKLWIRVNLTPRFDPQGQVVGILGIGEDITRRKSLERDFIHAQKMEAIGTLAGGIAHDFNNLLMGIQGRTSLMLMDMNPSHPHFEPMRAIEEYAWSAAGLTRQLLAFARKGKGEVEVADINEIIRRSLELFGRTRKEIRIHGEYQQGVWPLEVDRSQIEQVLMNLFVNAWQAMPAGGTLSVKTENVMVHEDGMRSLTGKPGKYVRISVTDTGAGMDEETQERIFEPFFTTKEMGRGTGLGLASAYGIVKGHDGAIEVTSRRGEGTTFVIYLPASEKETVQEKAPSGEILKGGETILLVDDEEMILEVAKPMLEKLGYKVLTAHSGRRALEIYRENRDRIDMVVLDMVMPDLSGRETFVLLRNLDPSAKVLLSSGYSIDGQAGEMLKQGCDGFIQKPFDMKTLSYKVREILDKKM